jgi:hypothetical protein
MNLLGTNVIRRKTRKTWSFVPWMLYSHNCKREGWVGWQVPGFAYWKLTILFSPNLIGNFQTKLYTIL